MDSRVSKFKAWITKHALTSGVFTREVEEPSAGSPSMIVDRSSRYLACYHGHEWQRSREAALDRIAEMKATKIKSLTKQLAKLKLPVEVPK